MVINITSQIQPFANLAAFPTTGTDKTIYLAEDTNIIYYWTGSAYQSIGSGGGGSSSWGGITGTLSNQTDLQTALDAKLNKSGSNADQDIDIGNFAVNAKSFKVNGTNGDGHVSLKHQNSNITANANESSLGADSTGKPQWKNDGNAVETLESQANKGIANGYVPLDASAKINLSYLYDSILGQLLYGGSVNASTLVATLTNNAKQKLGTALSTITLTNDGTAITGYTDNEGIYYIISTAGTFAGISFEVGDWLISNGSAWTKIDNTDAVSSVAGLTGVITAIGLKAALDLSGTNTGDQNLTPYAKHNTFFSTQWVCQPGSGVYAQLTALQGLIWFVPFKVDHDTVFTDIGMEVVVAAASSNINLALYNDDGTGQGPGTKIEESGNLSAATTGLKSYTFSPSPRTLLASSKIYWLAFQVSSATIALRYNQMISVVIPSTGAGTSLKTLSQAYGTFPASGSAAAFNTSSNNYKIMLKPQ